MTNIRVFMIPRFVKKRTENTFKTKVILLHTYLYIIFWLQIYKNTSLNMYTDHCCYLFVLLTLYVLSSEG